MSTVAAQITPLIFSESFKTAILTAAAQTPSGDNCQPFRFYWREGMFHIVHLERTAEHFLNINNTASYLSLGCLVEAVSIRARDFGVICDSSYKLPIKPGNHLVAILSFEHQDAENDRLSGQIEKRYTDRRVYQGTDLDHRHFDTLRRECSDKTSIRLANPTDNKSFEIFCQLDQIIWTTKALQEDLQHWLRLTPWEQSTGDGMPWRSLGIGQFERFILLLCRSWGIQRMLNALGGLAVSRNVLRQQLRSSGFIYLVTAKESSPQNIITCGRTSFRVWLDMVSNGHGVQPLSLPSFLVFAKRSGVLPSILSARHSELIIEAEKALEQTFQLDKGELPVWLFRTGRVPPPPAYLRAPRLGHSALCWDQADLGLR